MKKELKTLKELARSKAYWNLSETELKAEAVERVKNCKNRVISPDMCSSCGDISFSNEIMRCDACKRDIWFHNLTEEDLK